LEKVKMKSKQFAISVLAILMFSGILMTTVSAAVWTPSLPTDAVTMEITNPYTTPLCPDSYPFQIDLSNVGLGFDVADGSYIGWCVDIVHGITREIEYDVMLYSSYDTMAPIPAEDWNRINYILNNKEGTGCDVQGAIWYFINGGAYWWIAGDTFDPSADTEVQNMVNDADANGGTYEPGEGDILAIVCVPVDECGDPLDEQSVIIELEIPGPPGFTPGFWKHNIRVALNYPGHYSSFDDSGDHLTYGEVLGYVEATGLWGTGTTALEAALADLTAKGPGSEMIRRDAANALNHEAGYGDYED
jgi:hypothetical protein